MEAAGIEPAQGSRGEGWVYLIDDGGWAYKIGHARNPEKRLALLQTGTVEKLRVVAVIEGSRKLERDLHDLFGFCRLRGEWFTRDHEILDWFGDHGETCICTRREVDPLCFIHGEGLPSW
jgi:hypothetical protein